MDEEDGRPGALAAQPGPFDAHGGVSAPSLCHPCSHSSASDPGCPISDAVFAADVGNHERTTRDPGCPISDAMFASDVGNHEPTAPDPGCPISDALFASDVGNHERTTPDPGCPISDALFAADVGNHKRTAPDPGCPISDAVFAADVGNHKPTTLNPGCPISDAMFASDVGNHESSPSRAAALNEEKQHLHFRVFRSTTTFRAPSVRLLSGQGAGKHPSNTRPSTALNTQTWEGRRQLAPPQVEENHENVPGK